MKEFSYVVKDPEGIHARPAGELVKVAKGVKSSVKIAANGKKGDVKKIFSLMGLAIKQGHEVVVTIEGEDEDAAYETIKGFFEANL